MIIQDLLRPVNRLQGERDLSGQNAADGKLVQGVCLADRFARLRKLILGSFEANRCFLIALFFQEGSCLLEKFICIQGWICEIDHTTIIIKDARYHPESLSGGDYGFDGDLLPRAA